MQGTEFNIEDLIDMVSKFVKKNIIYFVVFFIIGISLGLYKFNTANNKYVTIISGSSEYISLDLISNEVNSIKKFVEEKNYNKLSKKIRIDSSKVYQLKKVSFNNISKDNNGLFLIQLETEGKENSNAFFVEAINNSLKENAFINKKHLEEVESLTNSLAVNKSELVKLEKLQEEIFDSNNNPKKFALISDPSVISNQIIKIKKDILSDSNKLKNKDNIYEIIDIVNIDIKNSLFTFLFKWLVFVFFVGTMFLVILKLFVLRK